MAILKVRYLKFIYSTNKNLKTKSLREFKKQQFQKIFRVKKYKENKIQELKESKMIIIKYLRIK